MTENILRLHPWPTADIQGKPNGWSPKRARLDRLLLRQLSHHSSSSSTGCSGDCPGNTISIYMQVCYMLGERMFPYMHIYIHRCIYEFIHSSISIYIYVQKTPCIYIYTTTYIHICGPLHCDLDQAPKQQLRRCRPASSQTPRASAWSLAVGR